MEDALALTVFPYICNKILVLILVLMEDALALEEGYDFYKKITFVLILVLMEDALALTIIA